MRVAVIGQNQFGKEVLEAFLGRGDEVAGVFCAPDEAGAPVDQLKRAAADRGIPVFQLHSLRTAEARDILRDLAVDLAVMAYVLQFAPEDFTDIPTHGTIQYHPSLLPRHRGPSSVNWPIILGESETGLTIFRPTNGLDEGPIVLQKSTPIGPDETVGQVYFGRLSPLGVQALLEAADRVTQPDFVALLQRQEDATYEGWCRAEEARINWHSPANLIFDLIRGCDPSPGAWTEYNGGKLQLFQARKLPIRSYVRGAAKVGSVAAVNERGFVVNAHGGQIEIGKVRYHGLKVGAAEFCASHGLTVGAAFGSS